MKNWIVIFLKGFCMGVADVIPGISGGTIAFIMGIYSRLINAIKSINGEFFSKVLKFQLKEAFNLVDWAFLAPLLLGIGSAIILLAKIVSLLLVHYPDLIFSFFFGLISASIFIIARKVSDWKAMNLIFTAITTCIAYVVFGMVPLETPNAWWFVFLSGAIAICAMILPGISGSFILLLLGKYQYILDAVHERNFAILLIAGSGMIVGILSFVRVVSWLLTKYYNQTICILLGLVIGSLRKIWPWKITTQVWSDGHKTVPIEQINVCPDNFSVRVMIALSLIVLGFAVAFLLGRINPKDKGDAGE